jgi:hypothetical protein
VEANQHSLEWLCYVQESGMVLTRFLWAMGTYAILATLAAVTLDGKMRAAVWIFLGGLAVKTLIAYKAPR